MNNTQFILFVLTSLILIATPGPDMILVMSRSIAMGGKVFKRNGKVVWRCRNCGYLHESEDAPGVCPACSHPQAHFELLGKNW